MNELFDIFIRFVLPPLIGGVIGLFTNWLAIKMLFYPFKPVYIGRFRLPFTPGIIPRRRAVVARAVGRAVADEIITEKELKNAFSAPEIKQTVLDNVQRILFESSTPIQEYLRLSGLPSGAERAIIESISDRVAKSVATFDVKNFVYGFDFACFLTEKFLCVFTEKLLSSFRSAMQNNGKNIVYPYVEKEWKNIESGSIADFLFSSGFSRETVVAFLSDAYDKIAEKGFGTVLQKIDVSAIIEEKINAMDIKQVADLTFRVMNHEMKAVVFLGGLLGALIGVINIFI